jgi:hypothetical protein
LYSCRVNSASERSGLRILRSSKTNLKVDSIPPPAWKCIGKCENWANVDVDTFLRFSLNNLPCNENRQNETSRQTSTIKHYLSISGFSRNLQANRKIPEKLKNHEK